MTDYDYTKIRICPDGCGWVLSCVHLVEADRQKWMTILKEEMKQSYRDGAAYANNAAYNKTVQGE